MFKIVWLTGALRTVWNFLKPLLVSRVVEFLNDVEVHSLAVRAVERATRLDIDGDGKHDHAVAELRDDLKRLGKKYYNAWLSLAVETAYQSIKG